MRRASAGSKVSSSVRATRVDVASARSLSIGASTAYRTERCFAEEGLEARLAAALSEDRRLEADHKLAATWTHLAEKRRIRA